jgi:hypothetical protein
MPRPSEKGTAKRPEKNTTAASKRTYLLSLPHLPTIVTRSTAVERVCSFGQAHVCALAAAGDAGALPPHPRDFLSHGSDASMCGETEAIVSWHNRKSRKPLAIPDVQWGAEQRAGKGQTVPEERSPPRGRKSPGASTHPRPGYRSAGCFPAEPASFSPGGYQNTPISRATQPIGQLRSLPQSASLSLNTACATDPSAIGITRL